MRPYVTPRPAAAASVSLRAAFAALALTVLPPGSALGQNVGDILAPAVVTPMGAVQVPYAIQIDGVVDSSANVDRGNDIVVDAAGSVYVAGQVLSATDDRDFAVISVKRNGAARWTKLFDGGIGGAESAQAILIDANGDLVVAGRLNQAGTGVDFLVRKMSRSDGSDLWLPPFVLDDSGGTDRADGIALHPSGDVVAGGETTTVLGGTDLLACRLDGGDGSQVWCTSVDGSEPTEVVGDQFGGIAVDPDGDVWIVGGLENVTSGCDMSIVKLDGATGNLLFRVDLDGNLTDGSPGLGDFDFASDIVIDGSGNAYVVGTTTNDRSGLSSHGTDLTVVKIDSDNIAPFQVWRQDVDFKFTRPTDGKTLFSDGDVGLTIALDSQGQVLAGGALVNGKTDSNDFNRTFLLAVKMDSADFSEDRVLWVSMVDGDSILSQDSVAVDIRADTNDDVIVAGTIEYNLTKGDHSIVKLDGVTGDEIFRVVHAGELETGGDVAVAIAIDGPNIVVTGGLRQEQTGGKDFDLTIVNVPEPAALALQAASLAALLAAAQRRRYRHRR